MKRVSRRLLVSWLTDCFHAIRKQTGSRSETGALGLKPCSSTARSEPRGASQLRPDSTWEPGLCVTRIVRGQDRAHPQRSELEVTILAHTPSLARDLCFHAQLLRPSAGCELLGLSMTRQEPERRELRVGSLLVCPEVTLALTQAYFVPPRDR